MRSPSKTICFCRIWGDFIIVIHGVTFESQSPQTRMITDFFLVLSVLNEQHFFNVDFGRVASNHSYFRFENYGEVWWAFRNKRTDLSAIRKLAADYNRQHPGNSPDGPLSV